MESRQCYNEMMLNKTMLFEDRIYFHIGLRILNPFLGIKFHFYYEIDAHFHS